MCARRAMDGNTEELIKVERNVMGQRDCQCFVEEISDKIRFESVT
jgi:hypothetical protein